ncbi:DUF1659 domain-containing protein [Bacillus sp. FJAT-52991]|uniref:DUF1659 domain-containing protein n=1 Tax=Bacillus kandeliae TaxID=3129297 RepID=A0ABZ2N526_9BACI
MAETMLSKSTLRLVFNHGVDTKGQPILKSKTFSNIDEMATATNLQTASQAIAALVEKPMVMIVRNDLSEIN